jgi:protein TonB
MAREGLRRHVTGAVPISIGLHLVALFLFFVIPLTAKIVLPMVSVDLPEYVRLAPMPPPPLEVAPPPPRGVERTPVASSVPTSAPPTIQPEPAATPSYASSGLEPTSGFPPGTGEPGTSITPPSVLMPPVVQKTGPVRLADLPVAPRKTIDARPVYPEIARLARREGTVVMEAVLDPTGRVTQLRVIRSVPMLDQAAMDAVRQWRYTPSTYGGQAVSVLMTITIRFTLQ